MIERPNYLADLISFKEKDLIIDLVMNFLE